jgi:hypothetical protein
MDVRGFFYVTAGLIGLYVALQPQAVKAATSSANVVTKVIRRLASPGVAGLPDRSKGK